MPFILPKFAPTFLKEEDRILRPVACWPLKRAEVLSDGLPNSTTTVFIDVNNTAALEESVPPNVSPAMREIKAAAKEADIVVMNEINLDPGQRHWRSSQAGRKGALSNVAISYCLPSPECSYDSTGPVSEQELVAQASGQCIFPSSLSLPTPTTPRGCGSLSRRKGRVS
ncbi:hypothetical protein CVT24_009936 [Panaeolus cyanescens]|uniref:Uncharacterized protein n=1 Tax=Panaeolus cyanescens TaxID=181874 RepID=A0A409X5A1_9AGAR|nr:hypothetical protein CVT24_009936 [Panaeolus cyanescens]